MGVVESTVHKLKEECFMSHPKRDKQRLNRARRRAEEKLDSINSFGVPDKTPQLAVNRIIAKKAVS